MSKEQYKKIPKIQEIKSLFPEKEDVFNFMIENADFFGIDSWDAELLTVSLRNENTPSVHLSPYLKYCDFGDEGIQKDLFDLVTELHNVSLNEAVKMIFKRIEESDNIEVLTSNVKKKEEKEEVEALEEEYIKSLVDKAQKFNKKTWAILSGFLRASSTKEKALFLKKIDVGLYNKKNDNEEWESRITIIERDFENVPYCFYSFNRQLATKGNLRYKARRVMFGSHLLKEFKNGPIMFLEGHSDTGLAISKSLRALTTGSATKMPETRDLEYLKGKELHMFPDSDLAGVVGIIKKALKIELFNDTLDNENEKIKIKVIFLGTFNDSYPKNADNSIFFDKTFINLLLKDDKFVKAIARTEREREILLNPTSPANPSNFAWLNAYRIKGFDLTDLFLSKEDNDLDFQKRIEKKYS
jgi:hypothetical protein